MPLNTPYTPYIRPNYNFAGGQVGYHNHQEYLKCLSAMQVRFFG